MRQNILVLEFQLRKHLLVRLHVEIFAICLRIQLESDREWRKINRRRGESEKEAWLSAEEVNKFYRGFGNLRCSHSIGSFSASLLSFKKR